jgi:hypothetical protein
MMKLLNMLPPCGDPARPVFIGAVYGLLGLVVVFGMSAALCAVGETWSSPAEFVFATVALPFIVFGLAFPMLAIIFIAWLLGKAVDSWAMQSLARQAALDALIARQRSQ